MKKAPATITVRTTVTLMATTTAVTRAESFVPRTRMTVSTRTRAAARTSKPNPFAPSLPLSASGRCQPALSSREAMYPDQPTATTAVPSANSSTRSQPMIQAGSSPREAYEKVYAEPATGTVEANSA